MSAVIDTVRSFSEIIGGIIGGIVATILLTWLALRAQKVAGISGKKKTLTYGFPVRVVGWILLLICLFVLYAATRAATNQIFMAWCVGIVFLLTGLIFFLEVHFVKISFDDEFIYTFSPGVRREIFRGHQFLVTVSRTSTSGTFSKQLLSVIFD